MKYISIYKSPVGKITLISNRISLTNLYIEGQKHNIKNIENYQQNDKLEIFQKTKKWLDTYFKGIKPNNNIKIELTTTKFSKEVYKILKDIPYGDLITYKDIAVKLKQKGITKNLCYQAVGRAVGNNPISIIIPCHRVIGSNNSLTGYNGGIELKKKLLELEGIKNIPNKCYSSDRT